MKTARRSEHNFRGCFLTLAIGFGLLLLISLIPPLNAYRGYCDFFANGPSCTFLEYSFRLFSLLSICFGWIVLVAGLIILTWKSGAPKTTTGKTSEGTLTNPNEESTLNHDSRQPENERG